ncbi:MAG TPA: tetratricopeptide repeat protein [Vicinamibacterales bacterium]|nr:tetratricopeptide repeat protein [Vicinamibacterales bacterium]
MKNLFSSRIAAFALALIVGLAPAALAQSTMIKGKVIDANKQPVVGVQITIEFMGGVNRKLQTKTDKRGEFIQLLTESGMYKVTATDPKIGSASSDTKVSLGRVSELTIVLVPSTAATNAAMAAELKKAFDEGVAASRGGRHDEAIEKFKAAVALAPNCFDCHFNIGVAYMAKKDEKAAEAAWKQALEVKADYPEALNALSTLYNNQKRFEEASAMSAKAAAAAGGAGNADATFNQGIILWNQGKIAEAKAKFEETIKMNASHADAHYQLGMALLNEGKLPEAVAAFEAYLKLAPDGQYAPTAKSMIAQLKK